MQRAVVTRLVTVGALALAAMLVVVLAVQKWMLEARVLDLSGRLRDPYPGFLVPPIAVPTLSGDTVIVGAAPPDRLQLLLVFTTTCDACAGVTMRER